MSDFFVRVSVGLAVVVACAACPACGGAERDVADEAAPPCEGEGCQSDTSGYVTTVTPCEEGGTRNCKVDLPSTAPGVQNCFVGVQTCVDGVWSGCAEAEPEE